MKQITKYNYEAYLLDYYEGNLSAELTAELILFTSIHEDLKIDLNDDSLVYLDNKEETYEDKSFLKNLERIEFLAISSVEEILTDAEKHEFEAVKNSNHFVTTLVEKYEATKLPMVNVPYPNKKTLKRTPIFQMYWSYAAAIAAAILVLITIYQPSSNRVYTSTNIFIETQKSAFKKMPILNNDIEVVKTEKPNNNIAKKQKNKSNNTITKQNITVPSIALVQEDSSAQKIQIPNNNIANNSSVDSSKHNPATKVEEENIAQSKEKKSLTVKEFVRMKTRSILLKEENPSSGPIPSEELLGGLAANLDKSSKMDVAYQSEDISEKKITKITLGKFEYYKSSSK